MDKIENLSQYGEMPGLLAEWGTKVSKRVTATRSKPLELMAKAFSVDPGTHSAGLQYDNMLFFVLLSAVQIYSTLPNFLQYGQVPAISAFFPLDRWCGCLPTSFRVVVCLPYRLPRWLEMYQLDRLLTLNF